MSGETWLLSAMALSAPASEATVSYTPEVREAVVVEMQRDCAAAENTFTGFAAVQENIKNTTSSREETASALKEQSTEAHKTISEIAPKTEVKFFNHAAQTAENEAEYRPDKNVILAPIKGKTQTNFDEKDIGFSNLENLAHEKHHEIVAHQTIQTSDGKTILAKEAPMSLEQRYMLEQADEIAAQISSCIALRETYRNALINTDNAKKSVLSTLENDEKLKKEYAPVISKIKEMDYYRTRSNKDFGIEENRIWYNSPKGRKTIKVKDPELLNQFKELCAQRDNRINIEQSRTYYHGGQIYEDYLTYTGIDGATKQITTEKYNGNGMYLDEVTRCNVLSQDPEDIKKEMQYIGELCAKNWKNQLAKAYEDQCNESTAQYFKEHNFQEVKANDENFNKALSATLTIAGWDFSDAVKGQLTCRNAQLIEADKMISNGANELDVINIAPDLLKKQDKIDFSGSSTLDIATEYTKGKSAGTMKLPTQPVVWTAEYKQEFAKNLTNIQNQINTCPQEQQEQANKLLESLNLNNQKEGTKLSAEQIDNLGKLSSILDRHSSHNPIYNFNDEIQSASVPDKVKKEWLAIGQQKGWSTEEIFMGEIKQLVVEAYSGQELGKSAEQFTIPQSVPKTYDGVEQSTITMTDLSQPFLLDRYNKYAEIAAAKERVGNKLDKTQAAENTPPAQTATKTSVNMAQLAAQRQGGR